MNNELLILLLSGEDSQKISLDEKDRKKIYREYEEAAKKFLEDGANTEKIGDMVIATSKYCNDYVDLLNMSDIVQFISNKVLDNIKTMEENQVKSFIEHAVFLGKISALYSMVERKKEEIRKDQEYQGSINGIHGLKDILLEMVEDNVSFRQLCKTTYIEESNLNQLLNNKKYFNIRVIGQQKLISLSPEGRKLRNYLKRIEEKRYSQEEVENYIFMNSHRLINMFRQPKGNLSKNVTIISLSDERQKILSFEFNYVYKEISSRQSSFDRDFTTDFNICSSIIDEEIEIFDNEEMELFHVGAGRIENEKQKINSKQKTVPGIIGRNNAICFI